jgi:hypothetical protein
MTIALATIKAALKIDYTDDDTELERIRDAAVAWVENYCGFALSSAARTMYLTDWQDTVFAVQPVTALRGHQLHERGGRLEPSSPQAPTTTSTSVARWPFSASSTNRPR